MWDSVSIFFQVNAEFTHITIIPLLSTFMGHLDHYSSQLMKILKKKGGAAWRRINLIMEAMDQVCVFPLKPDLRVELIT